MWTKAEGTARNERGLAGIRRKNNLLIAATLEELASRDLLSAILEKLSKQILAFAENTTA